MKKVRLYCSRSGSCLKPSGQPGVPFLVGGWCFWVPFARAVIRSTIGSFHSRDNHNFSYQNFYTSGNPLDLTIHRDTTAELRKTEKGWWEWEKNPTTGAVHFRRTKIESFNFYQSTIGI